MPTRVLAAISTCMVALVLAFAVPVSQLRTVVVEKSCCCPDPSNCHCPDHQPSKSGGTAIRACHQTQHTIVAPTLPAFTAPVIASAEVAAAPVARIVHAIPAPHAAPPPVRPDAPS